MISEPNRHELALRTLRSQSVSSLVRDAIEEIILTGDLKAGEHVSETAMSSRLQVSRGPVREACRALVAGGLLTAEANRGFFVRKVTFAEVIDVYDVRASLARLAGRTLAERATGQQRADLSLLIDEMDQANKQFDFEHFYELNLTFHNRFVDYCRNQKLVELNRNLMRELHIFRRRSLIAGENTVTSNDEHKEIMAAVAGGDVERSGEAMERHVLLGKARFLAAVGDEIG